MARDWRRYAHDLEAMLAAEIDTLRSDVRRAVVIEAGMRGTPGPQLRAISDAVADRMVQDKGDALRP